MTEVDVTVVIGQHGDALVKRVQDIVEGWTAAGILRPFVWWSGVHDAEHFVRWSGPDAAEQPLLTALGERPYRLIRLLTLIVVPGDSAEPARDVRDVATRVEAIVKRRRAVRQGVSLVNLVVPATGVTNLPGRLLDSAWDVNLVATDEDRATAEHSSLEVRAPDRLAAHAAIELATVAGLWSGMVAGAFDGDREGSGGQEATVRVIRSFARTVRSHGLVDQVANLVLDSHENQGWVAQAVGARLAKDPEHVVERAAADYFERAGGQLLCRTPPPVVSPPPVVEVSPWQAFRMMWDFMADRARQLPREWVDRGAIGARSAVEQFTQDATFGDDSTVVVRMGARTVTAHIGAPVPLTSGVVDLARALREKVAAQSPPATPPQAWRELRGLAFGLADAGPLPTGCTEPAGGSHRLVVPVDWISPDPDGPNFDPHPPDDDSGAVGAIDPAGAARVAEALRTEEPSKGAERDRFQDWLDVRRQTLLWRVGQRLVDDAAAAESGFIDALRTLAAGVAAIEVAPRATPRLRRNWLLIAAIALVGVIAAAVLSALDVISLALAIALGAGSALAWLLDSVSVFYAYLKEQLQSFNRYNRTWFAYEQARTTAEHEAGELVGIAAAYVEFQDWAHVIGQLLIRPGGPLPELPDDPVVLDALTLSAALVVARASTDDEVARRLAAQVGHRHMRSGWISALYEGLAGHTMSKLKRSRGQHSDDVDPDPITTPRLAAHCSRSCARVVPSSTSGRRYVSMRRTTSTRSPRGNSSHASTSATRGSQWRLAPGRFSPGSARDRARRPTRISLWRPQPQIAASSGTVRMWLPAGIESDLPTAAGEALKPSAAPHSMVMVLQSVRIDSTVPGPWSELTVFGRPPEENPCEAERDWGSIG